MCSQGALVFSVQGHKSNVDIIGMMVRFLMMIVVLVGFSANAGAQESAAEGAAVQFISSLPDVPVIEGARDLPDEGLVFDKPDGRIIDAVLDLGALRKGEVLAFYTETLPQMGWFSLGEATFERDGELLQLLFHTVDGVSILKIRVMPHSRFEPLLE